MTRAMTQRLYDWERLHVEPKAALFLSREECVDLAERAAAFAGMPAPSLKFVRSATLPCAADPAAWRIVVADWGRGPVTVLHEVAHLATVGAVARGEDPHGPSFLAAAIGLYAAFLGLDRAAMERAAEAVGLEAGTAALRPAPAHASPFEDVEF